MRKVLGFTACLAMVACGAEGDVSPPPADEAAPPAEPDAGQDAPDESPEDLDSSVDETGIARDGRGPGTIINDSGREVIVINIWDARGPDGSCIITPGGPDGWIGYTDAGLAYCLYPGGYHPVCECIFERFFPDGGYISGRDTGSD